jgi:hypothetical protein
VPYEVLKDRLLNNHSLTDFQKIERQLKMEPGAQLKLLELLAHLMTPADKLESKYLIFLFIKWLPKVLRMQLGDDLYGIFQRRPTACGPLTAMIWRPLLPQWLRQSQPTERAARLASLWLQSPLSRRSWIRVTGAAITVTKAANLPPWPTGRLSLPDPLEVGGEEAYSCANPYLWKGN